MWYTLGKLTHSYRLTFNYVHIIHIMLQIYTTRLHSKHNQMCQVTFLTYRLVSQLTPTETGCSCSSADRPTIPTIIAAIQATDTTPAAITDRPHRLWSLTRTRWKHGDNKTVTTTAKWDEGQAHQACFYNIKRAYIHPYMLRRMK